MTDVVFKLSIINCVAFKLSNLPENAEKGFRDLRNKKLGRGHAPPSNLMHLALVLSHTVSSPGHTTGPSINGCCDVPKS